MSQSVFKCVGSSNLVRVRVRVRVGVRVGIRVGARVRVRARARARVGVPHVGQRAAAVEAAQ